MTRATDKDGSSVEVNTKTANICRFSGILVFLGISAAVYFAVKTPADASAERGQFVVKNIPRVYTKLEGVDPEERDVFEGFRTSFLPPEEIVLSLREPYQGNGSGDAPIWDAREAKLARVKRNQYFFMPDGEQDETDRDPYVKSDEDISQKDNSDATDSEIDYSGSFEDKEYDMNDDSMPSVIHPEPHVDQGPLDDVVDQTRGQPELEEGEMETAAHIYKPGTHYTGFHSFWKGQGDRHTIRTTQANIMKQYMDMQADPCQDFYQYACGNWPTLNPIPADKAGYDTFEMLRENLDNVMKELLEFKAEEQICSSYPGRNLDLDNNFLVKYYPSSVKNINKLHNLTRSLYYNYDSGNGSSRELFNESIFEINNDEDDDERGEKSEFLNRIRRYLDKKLIVKVKPINMNKFQINRPLRKYNKYNKHINVYPNVYKNKKRNKRKYYKSVQVGRKLLSNKEPIKYKRDNRKVNDHIENMATCKEDDPANGDAAMKARYLFKSCMNDDILERRGHQPLLDLLNLLGGWPILEQSWNYTHFDWIELMAKLRLYNNDILISEWVGPDIKNSDEFVIQFDQTSLGLPTREYFLQPSNKIYLDAYQNYLITIALLLGGKHDHVIRNADDLIDFETRLAKITSAPEDRRNVSELYRRMPLRKLESLVPEVRWRRYLSLVMNRTVSSDETVVLFALNYVRHLVQLVKQTEPHVLANYLLWRFVRHRVNNLDDRFQSAKQQFYFTLFGREQAPPRWKNCISQVNSNMGMALGSMFVRKYFDERSKNDTLTMTREIQQSFREILHLTDWIDDETKNLAASKVDAMMLRIGYPDFILNNHELNDRYKEVKIHPDKYFENILNILQHLTKMEQSRLGQPVNKTLWNTAPAVVNAYYSRNKNQIMFPAGILQPPFYHRHFPRSLNYGGIGVVIGHEITHGFDDKGRLFDCDGNLHRWWSDSAIEAFHRRAQCLIDQYGLYLVPDVNMKLDGINTQGENIADNGGVKQAFRAYKRWLERHGAEDETLPGLNHTHTQLFFLNFAQVWCGAMRPEAMRNKLKTAVHAPGRFRVIGTLSNSQDFSREFRCAPNTPMNPKEKCNVW